MEFYEDTQSVPDRIRINKILKRHTSNKLGSIHLPSREFTNTEEGALEHLLSVHFSGSAKTDSNTAREN